MKTKLTKTEMKKAIAAAIREIEVVICPTCGCKNNYHYKTCIRVSHLFKGAK